MNKMGEIEKELAKYLINELKWGEASIAIGLCCNDDDLASKMLEHLQKHSVSFEEALNKAVELRESKYGKTKVTIED